MSFILFYTLFTLVVFDGPLFVRALAFLEDASATHRILTLGSLLLLLIFLQVVTLIVVSFFSVRLMRLVCMILLLINSAAFYFIVVYGTLIDIIIIRNVFATDTKTAVDLLHPYLFLFVLVLGVIPSLFVGRVNIVRSTWRMRTSVLAATSVAFFGYAFATSYNWLWFDRYLPVLGSLALPWNYVFNTAIFFRAEAAVTREQELLPLGDFAVPLADGQRQVVVLVLGEAARAKNHTLYGYDRVTNPYTEGLAVAALPNARSCAAYTLAGLACMLTHEGSDANIGTRFEPLPSYLNRQGVDVVWRTNSSGEPRVTADSYVTLAEIQAGCTSGSCERLAYDEGLLEGLEERIATSESSRIFIVLHQGKGSHGPAYYSQYPPEFERFSPVCDTVQIQNCSYQDLVNAYDNTIIYTDYILSRVITLLDGLENTASTMIYASDHGQALGENGVYLHGLPNAIAPDEMRDIPILVWMSDAFSAWRNVDNESITGGEAHGQDNIFHSVLGAFGLQSPVYKPEFDIFTRQVD